MHRIAAFTVLSLALLTACNGPASHTQDNPDAPPPPISAAPATGTELTVKDIRALIAEKGATATVQELFGTSDALSQWAKIEAHIAAGEQDWLALVDQIAPGTDAGTATGLKIAISNALTTNAAEVLKLAIASRPITEICAMNLIEPEPGQISAYKTAAIEAVSRVTAPELQAAKTECLAALAAIK